MTEDKNEAARIQAERNLRQAIEDNNVEALTNDELKAQLLLAGSDPSEIDEALDRMDKILEKYDEAEVGRAALLVDKFKRDFEDFDAWLLEKRLEDSMSACPEDFTEDNQKIVLYRWFLSIFEGMALGHFGIPEGQPFSPEENGLMWSFSFTYSSGLVPMSSHNLRHLIQMLEDLGWNRRIATQASVTAAEEYITLTFLKSRLNYFVGPTADYLTMDNVIQNLAEVCRANGADMRNESSENDW